jgi:hypothetical protein
MGSTAFLEPLIDTSPDKGFECLMMNLSIELTSLVVI